MTGVVLDNCHRLTDRSRILRIMMPSRLTYFGTALRRSPSRARSKGKAISHLAPIFRMVLCSRFGEINILICRQQARPVPGGKPCLRRSSGDTDGVLGCELEVVPGGGCRLNTVPV